MARRGDDTDVITTELVGEGHLNGYPIEGTALGFYDLQTNVNGGLMRFNNIPELENSLLAASCTSYQSVKLCVFSRATQDSVNLFSVMGAPFSTEVIYTLVDNKGSVIGQLQQEGLIDQEDDNRFRIKMKIDGWYNGPTSINWSPGYAIYLRQVEPDTIEGVYGQTIFYDGGQFFALPRRTYRYHSGKTLPFDEVWHYRLLHLDVAVEGTQRIFDYRATAFYTPAEAGHGDLRTERYAEERRDALAFSN